MIRISIQETQNKLGGKTCAWQRTMIENKIKQVTASINTNLPTNHTQNCKHRVLRK